MALKTLDEYVVHEKLPQEFYNYRMSKKVVKTTKYQAIQSFCGVSKGAISVKVENDKVFFKSTAKNTELVEVNKNSKFIKCL